MTTRSAVFHRCSLARQGAVVAPALVSWAGGTLLRATAGIAVIAGGFAEMVWLITLTPVSIYHRTARALRGDPFNGTARVRRLGRDERDEDAETDRLAQAG